MILFIFVRQSYPAAVPSALGAPVYDAILGRFYAAGRRRTVATLGAHAGQRVLLPGGGTGAFLPLLCEGTCAVGVDLSRAMLAHGHACPLRAGTLSARCWATPAG